MIETDAERVTLPPLESMSPDQKKVYDAIVSGPRGRVIGPLKAALHSAELADHWQNLGGYLRYRTSLPEKLKEFAVITVARRWNAELEWTIHSQAALRAGLSESVVSALKNNRIDHSDTSLHPDEAAVYNYCQQLQTVGRVSDAVYTEVRTRWGDRGVVELTGLIGYYTMVAMTLNAHHINLPDDIAPLLYDKDEPVPYKLTELAPLR